MKLSNLTKKLALILLSTILFVNSMAMPFAVARAADEAPSTWYNQGFTDWYAKVYGNESPPSEIFGERYTAAQVQWILYSLFAFPINILGSNAQSAVACVMVGISKGTDIKADIECTKKTIDIITNIYTIFHISGNLGYSTTESAQSVAQSIIKDYQTRPLSGIKYSLNTFSKFTSVPQVNAQGFGFTAVDGLQKYWQGFRDMSYALTVFVVIIFAFMIMFRVKLSPQLVISVQSALPKVFGALILATFSYAIAGFVIDLSYVVGGLFASLMNLAKFSDFKYAYDIIVPTDSTTLFGGFYILLWMAAYTVMFLLAAIWSLVGTVSGLSAYGFLASILAILMVIVVLGIMIWYTIKVPWVLLKNLISLFLSIVVGPIQIVLGALVPSIGFSVWFKKIIAEALVFPVTGLFMFLAMRTLNASFAASTGQAGQILFGTPNQNLWTPPIMGSASDMSGILWLAVSFTFITMIPKAVDIMKMLVMGAKFDFGTAMGEAFGPTKAVGAMYSGNVLAKRDAVARNTPGATAWSQAWNKGYWEAAKYIGWSALQKGASGR